MPERLPPQTVPLLLRIADALEKPVIWLGRVSAWLMLPLIGIILFDAVSRKFLRKLSFVIDNDLHFFMNSPVFQDAEWHLHAIIFLIAMGYAYACNAHVRLDIFRPRLGTKGRMWVELMGGLLLLIPFLCVLLYFSWDFFVTAWATNETTSVATGIGFRWFIKAFIFLGPLLLMMSCLSILIRIGVRLFGPRSLHDRTRTDAFTNNSHSAFN